MTTKRTRKDEDDDDRKKTTGMSRLAALRSHLVLELALNLDGHVVDAVDRAVELLKVVVLLAEHHL